MVEQVVEVGTGSYGNRTVRYDDACLRINGMIAGSKAYESLLIVVSIHFRVFCFCEGTAIVISESNGCSWHDGCRKRYAGIHGLGSRW